MPKPRIGTIPPTRLKNAIFVRNILTKIVQGKGKVLVTLINGTWGVEIKMHIGEEPPLIPGHCKEKVPIKISKVKRLLIQKK